MKATDKTAMKILFAACLVIMFTPIFFAAFISCEKINTTDEEIIDTLIYDNRLFISELGGRDVLIDTTFDLFVLGSDYKGREGLNLFLRDADSVGRVNHYIESFSGNIIRTHIKNVKQNLGCNDNAIGNNNVETITCNEQKIIDIVNSMSANLFYVDAVAVFANGKGHGSHSGGKIFIIGTGNHISMPFCEFYEGLQKKYGHEFGHLFGLSHENTTLHFMNDGTSGGCDAGDIYTLWQQEIIIHYIDSITN